MQRIQVEQQRVMHRDALGRRGTGCAKAQDGVRAVTQLVSEVCDGFRLAGQTVGREAKAGQRIGIDRRRMLAQLAPSDRTVAVAIQPYRVIQIAQGNRPLDVKITAA